MSKFDLVKLMWYHNKVRWKVRRLSGAPPLSFKGRGKNLKNYRIYGNTVNGESIGDRTANLFDENLSHIPGYINNESNIQMANYPITTWDYLKIDSNTTYAIKAFNVKDETSDHINFRVSFYDINKNFLYRISSVPNGLFDTPNSCAYIRLSIDDNLYDIMLIKSTSLPDTYEPYGYRVPVTVTNGTDTQTTNLYLPEQIKMVGDEAEYIDFGEQKQYFADGTSTDVLLPALPTISGTNTLSVNTEVQPSEVYVEGKIRFIHEGSGENEGE